MAATAAVVVVRLNINAAGFAERFFAGARIDALTPTTHHSLVAGTIAGAAVLRVSIEIHAQNRSAGFTNLAVRVGACCLDVLFQAGQFVGTQLSVNGHPFSTERFILRDLEVENRLVGVSGHDQLSFITVGGSGDVKESLVEAGGHQVQTGAWLV